MNYEFDFHFLTGNFEVLWDGLKVTLQLALISNVVGLVLGFGLCLLTLSKWFFIRWPAQLFIEFFRCTPALLQIVWFFYCLTEVGDRAAVLPRITGRAWVYGMHQIGVDPDDPLADGFMLSDTWGEGF